MWSGTRPHMSVCPTATRCPPCRACGCTPARSRAARRPWRLVEGRKQSRSGAAARAAASAQRRARTGMIPILHSPGLMMPGQLGPMSRVLPCSLRIFFTRTCGPPRLSAWRARPLQSTGRAWPAAAARHVVLGNALGDADHEVKLRFDALHDSLGGKRRRHVYHRRVGARRVHRLLPHPRAGEAAAASRGRGAARARARVGRTWTELNTGRPRCVVPPFLGVTPPTTCVP